MLNGKLLIAFDGTHSCGKTTLKYSVAAKLKEIGINCVVLPEPARENPLVDDVVLRDVGKFDLFLETDLIMNHVSQCIRGIRQGNVILSDRTPINVIAYTNLLVEHENLLDAELYRKCVSFVETWHKFYDLIFYCQDYYEIDVNVDNMRNKVIDIQVTVDEETRRLYQEYKGNIKYIPEGLSLEEKTLFAFDSIREHFKRYA